MKRRHFLWYSLLLAASCTATTNGPNPQGDAPELQPLSKLRFAITDAKGLEDLERDYEPFRAALETVLDLPVEFFPVEDYFAAAAALQSNAVDLVWAGPSEYVVIKARTNAVPIVELPRPEYYTVLWVRADSGITSLAELKGKTLDVRKNGSTSAHLGAVKLLLDAGLDPQTDVTLITSGERSLKPLETGEADAMTRAPYRYQNALVGAGAAEEDYPVLAKGQQLPGDIFILGSHLEASRQADIQSRMLANQQDLMAAIAAVESLEFRFRDSKLIEADDAVYDVIREAYIAIGQGDFIQ
ncbi:MAG: PhnD/SsuA/transferrin family substrate-binding protein [Cyanobacteria bacterium P01_F01_bin.56]